MKKFIGYFLLALPFLSMFILGWIAIGLIPIISIFLVVALIVGIIVLGVNLTS